jgi:hypothetical protein
MRVTACKNPARFANSKTSQTKNDLITKKVSGTTRTKYTSK